MNKKLLMLLVPTLISVVGCNNRTSENIETSSVNENVSTSTESSSSSEENPALTQLNILLSINNLTEIRKTTLITKDKVTYYDNYELSYYDENDGLIYVNTKVTKYNDLSNPLLKSTISSEVYYDGLYSYTLESDKVYYKERQQKTITYFTLGFDFSKLDNLTVEEKNRRNLLHGEVKQENINAFFNETKTGISSLQVTSITNSGNIIEKIEVSYTKNGFNVSESYSIGTYAKDLSLPKLIKTK